MSGLEFGADAQVMAGGVSIPDALDPWRQTDVAVVTNVAARIAAYGVMTAPAAQPSGQSAEAVIGQDVSGARASIEPESEQQQQLDAMVLRLRGADSLWYNVLRAIPAVRASAEGMLVARNAARNLYGLRSDMHFTPPREQILGKLGITEG